MHELVEYYNSWETVLKEGTASPFLGIRVVDAYFEKSGKVNFDRDALKNFAR